MPHRVLKVKGGAVDWKSRTANRDSKSVCVVCGGCKQSAQSCRPEGRLLPLPEWTLLDFFSKPEDSIFEAGQERKTLEKGRDMK